MALVLLATVATGAAAQSGSGASSPAASESSASAGGPGGSPAAREWGAGAWMFDAFMGQFNDEPEWKPDRTVGDQLRHGALYEVRVGYDFPFNVFVQGRVSNSLLRARLVPSDPLRNVNLYLVGVTLGYNIQLIRPLQIFPLAGLGMAIWSPDRAASETDPTVELGGGFRYFVSPRLALRGDMSWQVVPKAMRDIRARLAGGPTETATLWGLQLRIGVSLFVGGSPKQ